MNRSFGLGQCVESLQRAGFDNRWKLTGRNEPPNAGKGKRLGESLPYQDIEFGGMDRPTVNLVGFDLIPLDLYFLQIAFQGFQWQSGIKQGPEKHIPADSGKTIDVKMVHGVLAAQFRVSSFKKEGPCLFYVEPET